MSPLNVERPCRPAPGALLKCSQPGEIQPWKRQSATNRAKSRAKRSAPAPSERLAGDHLVAGEIFPRQLPARLEIMSALQVDIGRVELAHLLISDTARE